MVSLGQELRSSFPGQFCFPWGCHQIPPGAAVIWKFGWSLITSKVAHSWLASWCWLLVGDLSSFPHGCLQRTAGIHLKIWLPFPRANELSMQVRSSNAFYDLVSEIIPYHFCHILVITQNSLFNCGRSALMPEGKDHYGLETQANSPV